MKRQIIYRPEFDEQAIRLGGIAKIDAVLKPLVHALQHNPEKFPLHQSQWWSFRWHVLPAFGDIPALVVTFNIDGDGDVIMEWIEEYLPYP
jgi:hypothetical protein